MQTSVFPVIAEVAGVGAFSAGAVTLALSMKSSSSRLLVVTLIVNLKELTQAGMLQVYWCVAMENAALLTPVASVTDGCATLS